MPSTLTEICCHLPPHLEHLHHPGCAKTAPLLAEAKQAMMEIVEEFHRNVEVEHGNFFPEEVKKI